jgi:farnesyl diphosphate synthase
MTAKPSDTTPDVSDLVEAMASAARAVERELDRLLPQPAGREARLQQAMRYAVLNGGKRLRPFLVMASADLFHAPEDSCLRVAAAVEMVHCYSLVHDDLPCMDDDDLRRGKPTAHIQFDEATAVLAGDALLTLAFEVLADRATAPDADTRIELVRSLGLASGIHGMVGGQALDLAAEGEALELGEITRLQQLKTGAMIALSCEAGAILGHASPAERQALHAYAHDLGLAFQIADDLLDIEGSAEETGKRVKKDTVAGKATFVSLLGVDRARSQARILAGQASRHLDLFGEKGQLLRDLAEFVLIRRS